MVGLPPRAAAVLSARCSDGAHACNSARRVAIGVIAVGDDGLLSGFGNNGDMGGAPRGQGEAGSSPEMQTVRTNGRARLTGEWAALARGCDGKAPAQARQACRYSRTLCAPRTTTQP
ncbi:hypothetical protein EV715DRAFT_298368 [Schizophyllum commune]